ncbi:hypothetical protein GW626_19315 [Peribacillus muralis]|uniref:hypothetical protein n=1 Tax=Peribacillus muralis TaxID=264697 RepID=UPI001F4E48C5|nr:hypothetical protein [Peribacillus muralis]MCK1994759.1 hypothetical protein [Peribacillus muralis]MCK2015414.1 hypothetical protein [Peribacillus muralis]
MASIHEEMVQKTKAHILHHFIALVEAEGFSHVSVKKIARACEHQPRHLLSPLCR